MTIPVPPGWRVLALDALPREPWRNGDGWTRPVAHGHRDGTLAWRVSIAEIARAARFSRFDGLDRTAVLLRGGPVRLRAPERQWRLHAPGDLARFPGEWALDNTTPEREALLWNVMVARDQVSAGVELHRDAVDAHPTQEPMLAWVLAGAWHVRDAHGDVLGTLGVDQGLHGEAGGRGLALAPAAPGAALLLTRVQRL